MAKLLGRKYWKHMAIGVLAAVLLGVILINIAVVGGVVWLRGENGQQWVQSQLNTLTEQSGYQIEFSRFGYSFPQGLTVSDIRISDEDGLIAELDAVKLTPKILPLAARHAGLSISADTLVLHRLPEAAEEEEQVDDDAPFGLQPFTLPDLYFNRFTLNDLSIDRLDIRENVFGRAMVLTPDLYSSISLGQTLGIDVDLSLEQEKQSLPLPRRIQISAEIDPQTLDADLSELEIKHDAYTLSASGRANLREGGAIALELEGSSDDLEALATQKGEFAFTGIIDGTLTQPSINMDGTLSLELLQSRGLADVDFTIRMDDPANVQGGNITLSSAYDDKPVQITADIIRQENMVRFDNFTGTAPAITLSGQAALNLDTTLLDGALKLEAANLAPYSKLAGFALEGAGTLSADFSAQDGAQALSASANLRNLRYQDITAKTITATTALPDIKKIWPTQLDVKAESVSLAPDIRLRNATITLTDQGNDRYNLSADIRGYAMKRFTLNGGMSVNGIRSQTPAADGINFDLRYGGSDIDITGAASLNALDVTTTLQNFRLSSLPVTVPPQLLEVALNGDTTLTGQPAAPIIQADITSDSFTPAEGTSLVMSANGGYRDGQASLTFDAQGDRIERFDGRITMPMRLSLYPFALDLPESGLDGALNINARAGQISPLFLPPGHELRGDIALSAALSGSPQDFQVTGTLDFTDGTYLYEEYGAGLYELALNATLARDHLRIEQITANDREQGTLQGSGRVDFKDQTDTGINIEMNNFHLVDSQRANGYISSDFALEGQTDGYLLSGDVTLGRFDVSIPERFQTSIPQLNVVEKKENGEADDTMQIFALDIAVEADNQIFVRGWGLDAEFGGALDVQGTVREPLVYGELSSRRGRYEEFGRRFNLERAQLRFQGAIPPSPYLDIVATTDVDDISASVNLSGPFNEPEINLSSVPSLPDDEVMSRILFGRDMSTITPFQAIQLKNTLDRFSGRGGGGFDPLATLRSVTGLDDIRVDQDADEGPSVGVGKYLTDKVYMELEQGAGEASGAASLQIEVTPNIDVETEIGQDAQAGAGVTWSWDY